MRKHVSNSFNELGDEYHLFWNNSIGEYEVFVNYGKPGERLVATGDVFYVCSVAQAEIDRVREWLIG